MTESAIVKESDSERQVVRSTVVQIRASTQTGCVARLGTVRFSPFGRAQRCVRRSVVGRQLFACPNFRIISYDRMIGLPLIELEAAASAA